MNINVSNSIGATLPPPDSAVPQSSLLVAAPQGGSAVPVQPAFEAWLTQQASTCLSPEPPVTTDVLGDDVELAAAAGEQDGTQSAADSQSQAGVPTVTDSLLPLLALQLPLPQHIAAAMPMVGRSNAGSDALADAVAPVVSAGQALPDGAAPAMVSPGNAVAAPFTLPDGLAVSSLLTADRGARRGASTEVAGDMPEHAQELMLVLNDAGGGNSLNPQATGTATFAATPLPPAAGVAQWAPLRLPQAQPQLWGQPLQQALGERLQLQVANGIQHAQIRLDPANLGSLEIAIRQEGGNLQVQLSAGNSELLRQLHAISDSLRQGLHERQQGEVSVWVADSRQQGGGQGGQPRQEAWQQPGRALLEAEQGDEQAAFSLA